MRKSTRIVKKLLALFLVVLMSINTFAAVVGDNDGAAFITKAEFDSMKNDFQRQLDRYNSSIDNKVDGAIAAYLSGISIASQLEYKPIIANYKDIRWMHGPYVYTTKRKYTEFTTTDGKYVDTTGWSILDMENRRNAYYDATFRIWDFVPGGFGALVICQFAQPFDVPNGWGIGRYDVDTSRDQVLYIPLKNEDGRWVMYAEDGGIGAEAGHGTNLAVHPHRLETGSQNDLIGHTNSGQRALWVGENSNLSVDSLVGSSTSLLRYSINNIKVKDDGSGTYSLTSNIDNKYNPDILSTTENHGPWTDGPRGRAFNVACGFVGYYGNYWSKIGDGLCSAIKWKTQIQHDFDCTNMIYGLWPADVSGEFNVSPPAVKSLNDDSSYLNLAASSNVVEIPVYLTDQSIHVAPTWYTVSWSKLRAQAVPASDHSPHGSTILRIPLFYRIKWVDMYAGEFKDDKNQPLCKSGGLPLIRDSEYAGTLQLHIDYEEDANVDDSYITLVPPDDKIKFSLKNKPFNDTSASFLTGWRNLTKTGTQVSFNNLEETDKTIDLSVEVNKGSDVYLSIDPLTADGVYCKMTNIKGTFIVDS